MRRALVVLSVGVLAVALLRGVFHSSGGHRVTLDEAKRAFAQVGLGHPRVQASPPGVIYNYGRLPHLVSVSVFSGATPKVIFVHRKGMRVTRWANVMVYYNRSETPVVMRAATSLGDNAWSSSAP
jgi:hypothetical protein